MPSETARDYILVTVIRDVCACKLLDERVQAGDNAYGLLLTSWSMGSDGCKKAWFHKYWLKA